MVSDFPILLIIKDKNLFVFICKDTPEISCDFENDFICGYSNRDGFNVKWKRYTGSPLSTETGPTDGKLIILLRFILKEIHFMIL